VAPTLNTFWGGAISKMTRLVMAFAFAAFLLIYAFKFLGREINDWRRRVARRREAKHLGCGGPL
jgi:hypothetical protein